MPEEISDAELFERAMFSRLSELRTAAPGRVERYDAGSQTADVKVQLLRHVPDGDGGYETEDDTEMLPGIPVLMPRGGGFFVAFPLQQGDFVQVLYNERSLAAWLERGDVIDPGDIRMHHFNGAVALPVNLYPAAKRIGDASATNLVVGRDGGALITITPTDEIHLGGASHHAAVAELVAQAFADLSTAVVGVNTAVSPTEARALAVQSAIATFVPSSVAASKVKLQP